MMRAFLTVYNYNYNYNTIQWCVCGPCQCGYDPSSGFGSAGPVCVHCEFVHVEVVLLAVCDTGVLVAVACA